MGVENSLSFYFRKNEILRGYRTVFASLMQFLGGIPSQLAISIARIQSATTSLLDKSPNLTLNPLESITSQGWTLTIPAYSHNFPAVPNSSPSKATPSEFDPPSAPSNAPHVKPKGETLHLRPTTTPKLASTGEEQKRFLPGLSSFGHY
jgi:hypothetical protein